jgi:hypothetical protein
MQHTLTHDRPAIKHLSPRTWARKTPYTSLAFGVSFAAYRTQRAALLKLLRPLDALAWARMAGFTQSGHVRERNLLDQVVRLVSHEVEHLEQLREWRDGLSV